MLAKVHTAAEASLIPGVEAILVNPLTKLMNHLSSAAPIDTNPRSKVEIASIRLGCGPQGT